MTTVTSTTPFDLRPEIVNLVLGPDFDVTQDWVDTLAAFATEGMTLLVMASTHLPAGIYTLTEGAWVCTLPLVGDGDISLLGRTFVSSEMTTGGMLDDCLATVVTVIVDRARNPILTWPLLP